MFILPTHQLLCNRYLVFFTSEILAHCSGIIAVVFCGVTVKAFGETFYNDSHLSHHFWEITEYLLNTLLFTLGGCVWGDIVSKPSNVDAQFLFSASDWVSLHLALYYRIHSSKLCIFAFQPSIAPCFQPSTLNLSNMLLAFFSF